MDACPLLITSIVAVKPEDQGTFFQDFLGLSGYLCSIGGFYSNTALLRTRNAQNHNEAQLRRKQSAFAYEPSLVVLCEAPSLKYLSITKPKRKKYEHWSCFYLPILFKIMTSRLPTACLVIIIESRSLKSNSQLSNFSI
jgi:hypothetical protein